MKLITYFLFLLTFVTNLVVTSPVVDEIDFSDPFAPRPIDGRPVDGRPVDGRPVIGRPVEPRPIGSSSLETRQIVPNAFIIEFKNGYTHDAFKSYLADKGVAYEVRAIFNSPKVLVGISIELKDGTDYGKVESWEGVATIWPVRCVSHDNSQTTKRDYLSKITICGRNVAEVTTP